MPRLIFNSRDSDDHASDIDRIVDVCAARGHDISPTDARAAWQHHSDMACAGWLVLPSPDADDELFDIVRNLCDEA